MSEQIIRKAADLLESIRRSRPLVHNITNYVVMNFTANALLCLGASPVMAHAAEEVEEMVGLAGALVINIGTLSPPWIAAMHLAGQAAGDRQVPIVLDPVGAGATRLRTDTAVGLLNDVKPSVVRGNASEILALAGGGGTTKGVDATDPVEQAEKIAISLAAENQTVVAVTGPVDLVTDGRRLIRISNGHPLMGRVTGTGCVCSALVGAFCAVEKDPLIAAASALVVYGVAGELAADPPVGPGTYHPRLLDALSEVDAARIITKAQLILQEV